MNAHKFLQQQPTTVLVVGCSFAHGTGLVKETQDSQLWVNCLFPGCKITNLSQIGVNNQWIFVEAMWAMTRERYDVVLVAWTELARYNFHIGLELYCTRTKLGNDLDIDVNPGVTVTAKNLDSIGNSLRKFYNDHWAILDIVKYVNALTVVQQKMGHGALYFVNSLAAWPNSYFDRRLNFLPNELSKFEQDMLQVETRDDQEIFTLYNMIHDQYCYYGGIHEDRWLNLYQSLKSLQSDRASSTDPHPGYDSQNTFVRILSEKINR